MQKCLYTDIAVFLKKSMGSIGVSDETDHHSTVPVNKYETHWAIQPSGILSFTPVLFYYAVKMY